ncbi:MAG: putative membrane protein/domain [Algoriphagus marincola HL-49]|uniref:Putative membrane protein/domain n=1 Tax=Algoriphagus marincola HL-49 TaxID=1305737 RepID=A0A0P8AMZ2_9BACT|nr:MAG: putative membrane protein/domain [Algoriphagus marincola HL-49]
MGNQGLKLDHTNYAGFWLRFFSGIIDTLILWIPSSIFGWVFQDKFENSSLFAFLDFIQLLLIWMVYYGITEGSTHQATLGKRVLNLKVINEDGTRLNSTKAALRILVGTIVAIPLGLGIIAVGFTKRKQGWHDLILHCLVIKKE